MPWARRKLLTLMLVALFSALLHADDDTKMMRAATMDAGKMSASEKNLFEQSIRNQKSSLARETLDFFYRDALDAYHDGRYAEAQELLDKIYSVDPSYEDVASLRSTVTRLHHSQDFKSKRSILEDLMRKGTSAYTSGQRSLAISFWKQALLVEPDYKPAKERVDATNKELAQKEFEEGYRHYHNSEFDEAMENWSNAIALNPAYKNQGLLLLMSKVELILTKQKTTALSQQAADQYDKKQLDDALQTYQELLKLDPRNDEARRLVAKIKYQEGSAAFTSAQQAAADGRIVEAMRLWQKSIAIGYEIPRSQKGIADMEALMKRQHEPKPRPKPPVEPAPEPVVQPTPVEPPKPTISPENAAEAMNHYRNGIGAFRSKDCPRAIAELRIGNQLDASNERIYTALQRAEHDCSAAGKP